jgi:hypothetical protein
MEEKYTHKIVDYLESGRKDDELSDRFGQSYEELQRTVAELMKCGLLPPIPGTSLKAPRQAVNAKQIVDDIRAGTPRQRLMELHSLSPLNLQKTLRKLVQTKRITVEEFSDDLQFYYQAEDPEKVRNDKRLYLDFELPVFKKGVEDFWGVIVDISEGGIGVKGQAPSVSERMSLEIHHEDFFEIEAVAFEAECQWSLEQGDPKESRSGFRIIGISDKDRGELRKLIRLLTL